MIPAEFDYVAPETLDDALKALADGGEDAKLLAGGHSLLPLMKLRLAAPTLLVDLRRIPGLSGVQADNGTVKIGAMTTHHQVVAAGLGLVSDVAATIADQQVRNRGTIGGSLVHGDPASDLPAIVLMLDGSLTLSKGSAGSREIAAADFFQDYLTTSIQDDEVLTEIRVPSLRDYRTGYQKFHRRKEDWAMVAVSAAVKVGDDGTVEDARIGLTHMGNVPLRATAVEQAITGKPLDMASIEAASEHAADDTEPPADLNASQDYKRNLARVLCKRALAEAASA